MTREREDEGFTLPELLITVVVTGLILGILASAVIVMVRTSRGVETRLDVANDEQFVSAYLPADLSSATAASTDPTVLASLPGTNTLTLTWEDQGQPYVVSYRHERRPGSPDRWMLVRHRCVGSPPTCTSVTVANNLMAPPDARIVRPDAPIKVEVTLTLEAAGSGGTADSDRIKVSAEGLADGGAIDPAPVALPTVASTRSRCAERFMLVVDTSTPSTELTEAVGAFVRALVGTPSELAAIGFDRQAYLIAPVEAMPTEASTLAYPGALRYEDGTPDNPHAPFVSPVGFIPMLNATTQTNQISSWATRLRADAEVVDDLDGIFWQQAGAGANWDDALWRSFHDSTGVTPGIESSYDDRPLLAQLGTVVFIAGDGPNRNRTDTSTSSETSFQDEDLSFPQDVVREARSFGIRVVGVGNGADLTAVVGVGADLFPGPVTGALQAIAAAQCGGTVTVQSRLAGGDPAPKVGYTTDLNGAVQGGETQAETTRDQPSATFEYDVSGGAPLAVTLTPSVGPRITDASCSSGGETTPSTWSAGVLQLDVDPAKAVSCIFTVGS